MGANSFNLRLRKYSLGLATGIWGLGMDFAEWRRVAGTDLLPGRNPNEASRRDGANLDKSDPLYDLLFVEFDDQGRPFVPTAVDDAMAHVEAVAAEADPIVLVFVHGWKHSARDSDDNVRSFRRLLHAHAHAEFLVPRREGCRRRVVGLYVGWRGLTWHWLNIVQNLTFWGRKEGALRVALDSVRELFARLRKFRLSGARPEGSGPRLVIAGHSFGGLIVFSAVAEYLIESVAVPKDVLDPVAPFGDLTILVNPAFEAARYHPLHSILANRRFSSQQQVPVFISVTAENDWATGLAFPAGRMIGWNGSTKGPRQRATNVKTMGHVPWMRTHELSAPGLPAGQARHKLIETIPLTDEERRAVRTREDAAFRARVDTEVGADGLLLPGWSRTYSSGAVLRQVQPKPEPREAGIAPNCPFWVVRAKKEVVDGHNGIFRTVFLDFLRQVLDDVVRTPTAPR
jgi:hypothetical protein